MRFLAWLAVVFVFYVSETQADLTDKLKRLKEQAIYNIQDPLSFIKSAGKGLVQFNLKIFEQIKNSTAKVKEILTNDNYTFTAKLYSFALWPLDILSSRNGIRMGPPVSRTLKDSKWEYDYVNYVKEGKVTPVKDQGQCGSCYAFGAGAAVEAQYLIHGLGSYDFSEQQVIDCSYEKYKSSTGGLNLGCTSGLAKYVLQYFNETGVTTTDKYPYEAKYTENCKIEEKKERDVNFAEVYVDNEDHLAYLLNKNGPLVIYIRAGLTFNYYSEGVYNDQWNCKGAVDHAVLLSGIEKDEDGTEYWIIKNSWGDEWGEEGYIRFAKGHNICEMITHNVTIASLGEIITE